MRATDDSPSSRRGAGPDAARTNRRAGLRWSLLALGLLGGLVVAVGPEDVIAPLAGADLTLVVLALLAAGASLGCRQLAYEVLCRRTGASPVGPRFHLYLLVAEVPRGIVPFGYVGGPVINATYLSRGVGAKFAPTVAALAVSELLAVVASGFVLGIGLLLVVVTGGSVPSGRFLVAVAGFVTFALGSAVLFVLAGNGLLRRTVIGVRRELDTVINRYGVGRRLVAASNRLLGEWTTRFRESVSNVSAERSAVAGAFLLNGLAWLLGVLPLYLAARAVGFPIPVGVVMLVVPLGAVAGVVPTPAGLGAMEVAYAGMLVTLAGAAPATATAATLLFRLSTGGFEIVLGGLASLYVIASRP